MNRGKSLNPYPCKECGHGVYRVGATCKECVFLNQLLGADWRDWWRITQGVTPLWPIRK